MARIKYLELVDWLEKHPEYRKRFEMDVPAKQSLYIEFDTLNPRKNLDSENYETSEGSDVVLDIGKDGLIYGLEIT